MFSSSIVVLFYPHTTFLVPTTKRLAMRHDERHPHPQRYGSGVQEESAGEAGEQIMEAEIKEDEGGARGASDSTRMKVCGGERERRPLSHTS